jgi:hypothetical protein
MRRSQLTPHIAAGRHTGRAPSARYTVALNEHYEELDTQEAVMSYAFKHEKEPGRVKGLQDALDEDEWRERYLDRMEKREYV